MLPFVQLAICLVYEIDCFLVGGDGSTMWSCTTLSSIKKLGICKNI